MWWCDEKNKWEKLENTLNILLIHDIFLIQAGYRTKIQILTCIFYYFSSDFTSFLTSNTLFILLSLPFALLLFLLSSPFPTPIPFLLHSLLLFLHSSPFTTPIPILFPSPYSYSYTLVLSLLLSLFSSPLPTPIPTL